MNRFILGVILMAIGSISVASDRYISIDTLEDNDSVGPAPAASIGSELENSLWRLRQYRAESGEMTPVLTETTVDIEFGQGEMGGSAGCNRYFGRYTGAQDNRLTVGSEIGSTQMACPPPIAEQERQYLGLLSRVSAWQQRDESLLLVDEDGELLLQYTIAEPIPLEGTPWQAVGINNGRGGVVSSNITRLATATFADGKISGNASCNRFSASYEIQGDRITIGEAATTRKQCPQPDVMEQERQYLQALMRARTVTLTSDKLELRDENGSLQVSYRVANP